MGILDKLPVVNKCFGCMNVMVGSIIAAFWGTIHGATDIFFLVTTKACKTEDEMSNALKIATYASSGTTLLFIISCLAFFIGIFIHKKVTALMFLYCKLLCLLTKMLLLFVCIQVYLSGKNCNVQIFLLLLILDFMIWGPFLLIVRSHKDKM